MCGTLGGADRAGQRLDVTGVKTHQPPNLIGSFERVADIGCEPVAFRFVPEGDIRLGI